MKKFIRFVVFAAILFASNTIYAQVSPTISTDTSTTEGLLHYIMEPLDKSQIPTGFLAEWGAPILPMATFNGILTDSNRMDMNLWRTLYFQLQTAYCGSGTNPLYPITTVNNTIRQNTGDSLPVPIPLLIGEYNSVKSDAFTNNLLSYNSSQNQVHDVAGRTQSPYQTNHLFAGCPNNSYTLSGTATFVCKPSMVWNNTGKSISSVQINFANGDGFKNITMNTPVTVSYTDTGMVRWTIKVTLSDNTILQCYSQYHVLKAATITPMYAGGDGWNDQWFVPGTANYDGARVFISYTSKNRTNTMRKPLIVVEGYDVSSVAPNIQRYNYTYGDFVDAINEPFLSGFDFNYHLDDLAGYDLVFIDFDNGTDDIRRNAALVEHVIDLINTAKAAAGSTEQNVVMGLSMGGLVARYALAEMTKNNEDPETRLLITHDSPHRGANVPLGIQYFMQMFGHLEIFGTTATSIYPQYNELINLLEEPATKQMLIYRATGPNTYATNTFLDGDYRNMVTFSPSDPQPGYRFIATSLGSQCGQQLFSPGKTFFNLGAGVSAGIVARLFFFRIPIVSYNLAIDAEAYALPASGVHKIAKFYAVNNLKLFGFIDVFKQLYSNTAYSSGSQLPVDGVAGATYPILDIEALKQIEDIPNLPPIELAINVHLFYIFGAYFDIYAKNAGFSPQFCFVPTASALDVDPFNTAALGAPYVDGYNASFISRSAGYIAEEAITGGGQTTYNNTHIRFTARNAEWLYDEMEGIPNTLNCSSECMPDNNFSIQGPDNFCTSATYNISGVPTGMNISWSASPSGIVSLTPNGSQVTVTKVSNGDITLTATVNSCSNFTISKTVHVGVPPITDIDIIINPWTPVDPLELCPFGVYTAKASPVLSGDSQYKWWTPWPPFGTNPVTTSVPSIPLIPTGSDHQIHLLKVERVNGCGTSDPFSISVKMVDDCQHLYFTITPNPAGNTINITTRSQPKSTYYRSKQYRKQHLNTSSIRQIKVYDLSGRLRIKQTFSDNPIQVQMDISNLTPGIYIVKISDGKFTAQQKLVVQ